MAVLRTRADLAAVNLLKPGHCACSSRPAATSNPEKISRAPAREIAHSWPDARFSRAYRNVAVGFDGPDFINLVVGFTTAQPLDAVIARLRAIETQCGRPRYAPKWASRTMDLDVLLFGDRVEKTARIHAAAPGPAEAPVHARAAGGDRARGACIPTASKTIGELWQEFDRDGHSMTPVDTIASVRESPARPVSRDRRRRLTTPRCGRRPRPGSGR